MGTVSRWRFMLKESEHGVTGAAAAGGGRERNKKMKETLSGPWEVGGLESRRSL